MGLGAPRPREAQSARMRSRQSASWFRRRRGFSANQRKSFAILKLTARRLSKSVWNAWLNRLSRYVMSEFDAQVSMPKLEAIEQARAAGSRRVTDPAVRKILNEIAREIAARE